MSAILIIDDDDSMRSSLWHMVKRMGHQVECAATLREGLEKAATGAFDVVLLDVSMPDGNGLDVLPDIQRTPAEPEVIIITGYGNPDSAGPVITKLYERLTKIQTGDYEDRHGWLYRIV